MVNASAMMVKLREEVESVLCGCVDLLLWTRQHRAAYDKQRNISHRSIKETPYYRLCRVRFSRLTDFFSWSPGWHRYRHDVGRRRVCCKVPDSPPPDYLCGCRCTTVLF